MVRRVTGTGCKGCSRNSLCDFCFYSEEASPSDEQAAKDPLPNTEGKFLFGSSSISSLSFQSVAATSVTSNPFQQKSSKSSPGFAGAGSPLFASKTAGDLDESVTEDDHDGPHFEPIIPLPDKIDVKTGEEDEEVMFSHRAKLYRFVAEDKQWKERGVGDIKLLRNRQSGKIRVLMRRDQVLKICANHQITTDMKLQPNAGSDRSWVWSTLADFSEQECKAEQLAVRFKSEDIAKQFKDKFEECQELLKNQTPEQTPQEDQGHEEVKEDLLTKFKAAEGSWECDTCMVRNNSDKFECAACGGLKPGAEPSKDQNKDMTTLFPFRSSASSSSSVFSFGSATSSTGAGVSFGSAATSQGDARFLSFGSADTSQGGEKSFFSFGSFSQTSTSSSEVTINFGSFAQGGNLSGHNVENQNVASQLDVLTRPEDKDDNEGNEVEGNAATDDTQAEDFRRQETVLPADPIKVDREEKPLKDGLPISSGEESFQRQQHDMLKQTAAESGEGGNDNLSEAPDKTHSEEKCSPSSEEPPSREEQPVQGIPRDCGTEDAASNAENNSEWSEEGDLDKMK